MHSRPFLGGGSAGDKLWSAGVKPSGFRTPFMTGGLFVYNYSCLCATCALVFRSVFHVLQGGFVSVCRKVVPGSHRTNRNNDNIFILFSLFKSECLL